MSKWENIWEYVPSRENISGVENRTYSEFLEEFKKSFRVFLDLAQKNLVDSYPIPSNIRTKIIEIYNTYGPYNFEWNIDMIEKFLKELRGVVDDLQNYIESVNGEDARSIKWFVDGLLETYNNIIGAKLWVESPTRYVGVYDEYDGLRSMLEEARNRAELVRRKEEIESSWLNKESLLKEIWELYYSVIDLLISMLNQYPENYFDGKKYISFGERKIKSYNILQEIKTKLENLKKKDSEEIWVSRVDIAVWKIEEFLAKVLKKHTDSENE